MEECVEGRDQAELASQRAESTEGGTPVGKGLIRKIPLANSFYRIRMTVYGISPQHLSHTS